MGSAYVCVCVCVGCCEQSKAKSERKAANEKKSCNHIYFAESLVLLSDYPSKDARRNKKLGCTGLFSELPTTKMVAIGN